MSCMWNSKEKCLPKEIQRKMYACEFSKFKIFKVLNCETAQQFNWFNIEFGQVFLTRSAKKLSASETRILDIPKLRLEKKNKI